MLNLGVYVVALAEQTILFIRLTYCYYCVRTNIIHNNASPLFFSPLERVESAGSETNLTQ